MVTLSRNDTRRIKELRRLIYSANSRINALSQRGNIDTIYRLQQEIQRYQKELDRLQGYG